MSLQYYVRHPTGGSEIRMCKTAFYNIFYISAKHVRRAAQVSSNFQCSPKVDSRGKHTNRIHAVKEDVVETVKQHIRFFPRYRSHYSLRDNPHKTYITSVNSVEDMCRLYCKRCEESNVVPAKGSMYRCIFNKHFNIAFKLPRSDTCRHFDEYKICRTEEMPLQHRVHLLKAQQAYDTLKEARKNSHDEDSDTLVIAVDLQQALPTPHLATETVFYLHQLWK
jgi:hypothetical protein